MKVHFDGSNPRLHVELKPSEKLEVTMEGNPTTGFQWQVASLDMEVLDWTEGLSYEPSEPDRIGSGGKCKLGFVAKRKGRTTLKLVYRRPWEDSNSPAKVFQIKVVVR